MTGKGSFWNWCNAYVITSQTIMGYMVTKRRPGVGMMVAAACPILFTWAMTMKEMGVVHNN